MCSFLTEGSKFLIFDTSVCRNTAWYPSGADSLPRVAETCSLGRSGAYAIASVSIFFLCLILVCLKAPEKRVLDPGYGTDSEYHGDSGESTFESNNMFGHQPPQPLYYPENHQQPYNVHGVPRQIVSTSPRHLNFTQQNRSTFYDPEDDQNEYADDDVRWPDEVQDDLVSARLKSLDPTMLDRYPTKPIQEMDDSDENDDDGYNPTKKPDNNKQGSKDSPPTVSESRLHTIEKMKLNTTESDDMIEKFVTELNDCFEMETKRLKNITEVVKEEREESKDINPAIAALSF